MTVAHRAQLVWARWKFIRAELRFRLIMTYGAVLHIVWAGALVTSGALIHATALDPFYSFSINIWLLAGFLLVGSGLALWAIADTRLSPFVVSLFVLPQQFGLILSAIGAGTAITRGQFADGVIRDPMFLLVDQVPAILIAFFHALQFGFLVKDRSRD